MHEKERRVTRSRRAFLRERTVTKKLWMLNAELALSRPSANRYTPPFPLPDYLPSRALLSYLRKAHLAGLPPLPSLYVLPPPAGNQSRSSYFRTIQPVPPVPSGLHARFVRDASEDSQWNLSAYALFAKFPLGDEQLHECRFPFPISPRSNTLSIFNGELCNRDGTGNEVWAKRKVAGWSCESSYVFSP